MQYEKHYNRDAGKRYDKGGGKSGFSLKPLMLVALIILAAILIYQYRTQLSDLLSNWKTADRESEVYKPVENNSESAIPVEGITYTEEVAEETSTDDGTPMDEVSTDKVASTPATPEASTPIATTPASVASTVTQPKTTDRSKHRIECFRASNGRYGFTDKTTGETFITAEYDSKSEFKSYGNKLYAVVWKNRMAGVIDLNNNAVVPFVYSNIELCSKNRAYFMVTLETDSKTLYGLIRATDGKVVIPTIYTYLSIPETTRFIIVQKGEYYGAINDKGEVVVPIAYKDFGGGTDVVGFREGIGKPYLYYTKGGVPVIM